jgi:hypothetical protein
MSMGMRLKAEELDSLDPECRRPIMRHVPGSGVSPVQVGLHRGPLLVQSRAE